MKFTGSVSLLLSLASLSLAQDLSSIPQCASAAVLSSIGSTGCQLTDVACICKNTAFLNSLLPAITKACSAEDLAKTEAAAQQLCLSASVTISVPGASMTAASAAPSDTATVMSGTASDTATAMSGMASDTATAASGTASGSATATSGSAGATKTSGSASSTPSGTSSATSTPASAANGAAGLQVPNGMGSMAVVGAMGLVAGGFMML